MVALGLSMMKNGDPLAVAYRDGVRAEVERGPIRRCGVTKWNEEALGVTA